MEIPKTTVAGATSNAQQFRRRMAPASTGGAADVLHLSGAAVGVRDEATGRDMMLDAWQYGSPRGGRLQGFDSSWWNAGTDLGTWWAGQDAQGNPFLDKEE